MKTYKEFLLVEKSIGSENVRNLYYSDIDKTTFYNIINIDPTSVRKKDFSKLGKYSKWLLREFKKGDLSGELIHNKEYRERLNYYLFIYSTSWFKNRGSLDDMLQEILLLHRLETDILKLSLYKFMDMMGKIRERYEVESLGSKFDYVYSDRNLDILVPLNYTASFETAKNTEWCSKSLSAYKSWNETSILYRIIFKSGEKLKLTWSRDDSVCNIATVKYPEISVDGNPFEKIDGVERWEKELNVQILYDKLTPNKGQSGDIYNEIERLMLRIPDGVKDYIVEHHEKNKR